MGKVWRAVKLVAFNLLVLNSIMVYPIHRVQMYCGLRYSIEELPSGWEILLHFVVFALTQEVIFYYTHRYNHSAQIHKNLCNLVRSHDYSESGEFE